MNMAHHKCMSPQTSLGSSWFVVTDSGSSSKLSQRQSNPPWPNTLLPEKFRIRDLSTPSPCFRTVSVQLTPCWFCLLTVSWIGHSPLGQSSLPPSLNLACADLSRTLLIDLITEKSCLTCGLEFWKRSFQWDLQDFSKMPIFLYLPCHLMLKTYGAELDFILCSWC